MDSDTNTSAPGSNRAPSWIEALRGASALCALVFSGLLVGSGVGLEMSFVPSQAEAFASVLYLRQQGGIGALLRAMHHHLASGIVVATFLMVVAGALGEEHRARPAEFRLSVAAMLLMMGFCFTGYLLPMDQPAYWGTSVRLGIVETLPVIGVMQADMLRGGPAFGAATLPRFYALHVTALPLALVLLVLLGFKDALNRAARVGGVRLIATCGLIALVAWAMAVNFPAPLEPRADAADPDYAPRPEWYFLWLFQFGKYVHGLPWVESALLPVLGVGALFILPEVRATWKVRLAALLLVLGLMSGLSALALYEDRGLPPKPQFEEGRLLKAARDYRVECASCHGVAGRGDGPEIAKLDAKPKDFTAPRFWDGETMKNMIEVVTNGEAPDMPAFGGRLSEQEILAIVQHVEATFRPAVVAIP